jgi:hypothetical protein
MLHLPGLRHAAPRAQDERKRAKDTARNILFSAESFLRSRTSLLQDAMFSHRAKKGA